MLVIRKEFVPGISYPVERLGKPEEILYFDIETTGFSPENCMVYLIGAVYCENNIWKLIQWFADTRESEVDVLNAFSAFSYSYTKIIHFNGDGFDIPFLEKRAVILHLKPVFQNFSSLDIYREIRPLKKMLAMDHMNQKSIEHFLGINREDIYNGGQLIEFYYEYLATHSEVLYHFLLLHNEEDIKGMLPVSCMLNYRDLFHTDFSLTGFSVSDDDLVLSYTSAVSVPVKLDTKSICGKLTADGNTITLSIFLFKGELKHFYENYADYFYLPIEDQAVHKSIGIYVSPDARKKATQSTCYTRKKGVFIPQWNILWSPEFKESSRAPFSYAEFNPKLFDCRKDASAYLQSALTFFLKNSQ